MYMISDWWSIQLLAACTFDPGCEHEKRESCHSFEIDFEERKKLNILYRDLNENYLIRIRMMLKRR